MSIVYKTEKLSCEEIQDNIILYTILPNAEINEGDIKKIYQFNNEQLLSQQNLYAYVYVLSSGATVDNEARHIFSSSDRIVNRKAEAFVLNSLAQKLLVRFYINFNVEDHPCASFSSKEKAIAWVKSLQTVS